MRITGLATGLDVDSIITQTMRAHRIKIDQVKQKKDLVEVRQKLYRDVVSDCRKFFDKYLDVAKSDNLIFGSNYSTVSFKSSDETIASAKETSGALTGSYTVEVKKIATPASLVLKSEDLSGKNTIRIQYGDTVKDIGIDGLTSQSEIARKINSEISSSGVKAYYSEFAKGIVIESTKTGTSLDNANKFTVTVGNVDSSIPESEGVNELLNSSIYESTEGQNAEVIITDSKGRKLEYSGDAALKSNSVIIDNVEFTFNKIGTVSIDGKKDVANLKDKIKSFVNDYNTLLERLNVVLGEKKNSSYMPLTADQKKEMSEEEIKLWDEKVKVGQLSRDMHLTSLVNSMKSAMTTFVSGTGTNLESIGITPNKDYSTKNGTFSIDENKLTKALEENIDNVMTLFINTPDDGSSTRNSIKNADKGILYKLKDIIYDTTISTKSTFLEKVGYEGARTYTNNELTRNMETYQRKIDQMEKDFSRKEQALYSQWAKIETSMNNYNSQMSYLSQLTGGSY